MQGDPTKNSLITAAVSPAASKGESQIWLSGAALAVVLLSVLGLLLVVCINGLGLFWPKYLAEYSLADGSKQLGEISASETGPPYGDRTQLRVGNRDLYGADFVWLNDSDIAGITYPQDAIAIERLEWGPFFGTPVELKTAGGTNAYPPNGTENELTDFFRRLEQELEKTRTITRNIKVIEQVRIGAASREQEQLRLERRRLSSADSGRKPQDIENSSAIGGIDRRITELENDFRQLEIEVTSRRRGLTAELVLVDINGTQKTIPLQQIVDYYPANRLSLAGRIGRYCSGVWRFVSGDPRESNTEGGVFPAIFGTVLMVVLMSIITTPLGVVAALFLREYSRQGPFVSLVRICVSNLAGVPSIVYGVFGLGFFVYFLGAHIDQAFYAESLPTPTFGTGGILWASLTLALLTMPTVIVTAEEGLAALPRHLREGSYALGATKAETVIKVILPALSPAILTGAILATARAAGEVAPLMLTGVVKLAPSMPIDGEWPFFHFDRKFMHLGFHIFDVGFQSPNVEAARPMVFATTVLLLLIVVLLNVTAVRVRAKLRKKYSSSAI